MVTNMIGVSTECFRFDIGEVTLLNTQHINAAVHQISITGARSQTHTNANHPKLLGGSAMGLTRARITLDTLTQQQQQEKGKQAQAKRETPVKTSRKTLAKDTRAKLKRHKVPPTKPEPGQQSTKHKQGPKFLCNQTKDDQARKATRQSSNSEEPNLKQPQANPSSTTTAEGSKDRQQRMSPQYREAEARHETTKSNLATNTRPNNHPKQAFSTTSLATEGQPQVVKNGDTCTPRQPSEPQHPAPTARK